MNEGTTGPQLVQIISIIAPLIGVLIGAVIGAVVAFGVARYQAKQESQRRRREFKLGLTTKLLEPLEKTVDLGHRFLARSIEYVALVPQQSSNTTDGHPLWFQTALDIAESINTAVFSLSTSEITRPVVPQLHEAVLSIRKLHVAMDQAQGKVVTSQEYEAFLAIHAQFAGHIILMETELRTLWAKLYDKMW